ncbi:Helix-turn-helix domain-containing protein [Acinetobacter marinus]|uniref:Helix-turn-helix domain-containing protein n=1 Tax=Acinetobacter marinus TaxID=281375 RepID=A0A1G6MXP3_9GAMM|nr:AraC family transcriptional regulator ligand-binding domain-containing protein [Acinetobacter marinus]SDC60313.1 Helix-turn-helix domain-containing protein [Acinetobacter marinus]
MEHFTAQALTQGHHEDRVHSSALRGYLDVMHQLGTDPLPIITRHGISLEQLQDDNAWIAHSAMIYLLEDSAQQSNCADLGLRISRFQDIGILGMLGLILQSASTLREVIKYSSDLLFLHGSALRLYINEHVTDQLFENSHDVVEIIFDIQLNHSINLDAIHTKRQSMDLGLAVCHLQYLADSQVSMSQIASVLGFSEQSALSRACKSWFGMTPRALKKST